jgi:putative tryptophan/tyrosine transport system substrate-binding protein
MSSGDERMRLNRGKFLALLGSAIAWPLAASIPSAQGGRRVGFLHPSPEGIASLRLAAFREGLRGADVQADSGVEVVARFAGGNVPMLPALARELAGADVKALVAVSPPGVRAAREATATLAIIAVDLESDPIASGWADGLARPGRNVSGVFMDLPDFSGKCLQILREAVPTLSNVGILWDPAVGSVQLEAVEKAAAGLGLTLDVFKVARAGEFEAAFRAITQRQARGALMLSSPLFSANSRLLAYLARQTRLPAISLFPEFAEEGGLLAYGPDLQVLFRQAGEMTRKILDGTQPAVLPIERPTHFRLVVNLKTAHAFKLEVSQTLLTRADDVID